MSRLKIKKIVIFKCHLLLLYAQIVICDEKWILCDNQ